MHSLYLASEQYCLTVLCVHVDDYNMAGSANLMLKAKYMYMYMYVRLENVPVLLPLHVLKTV